MFSIFYRGKSPWKNTTLRMVFVKQWVGIWARTWRRNRRANIEIQIGVRSGRTWASQGARVVKNPPANAGGVRDMGSIPGSERPPRGGHGNSLQYSCLGNPMVRGAWRAAVHGVVKSQTRLKWLNTHACSENLDDSLGRLFKLSFTCTDFLSPFCLLVGL